MKFTKFLCAFLAIIMIVCSLSLPLSAADLSIEDYYKTEYTSEKAKIDTMKLVYETKEYGYQLYFDALSGEFAIKDTKTGEYTFSNPYDVAANVTINSGAEKVRYSLLSQIMLKYSDTTTGTSYFMSSYEHAAMNGDQISYTTISNGIRVEYAMGTVESKRLLPRWIEAERFQTKILNVLKEKSKEMSATELFIFNNLTTSYYSYKDQTDPSNEAMITNWRNTYKCLENNHEMKIYTVSTDKNSIIKQIEALIRKYCPEYTYEDLEYDHELTQYEGDEKEPALFRLAIEYTFDSHGFVASIPAKSIRYNETNYTLESVTILPYFGCSSTKDVGNKIKDGGFIFIPDGSGTTLDFIDETGAKKTGTQGTSVYGTDFAYENLSSTGANQEVTRIPVYGLVENYSIKTTRERSGAPTVESTESFSRGYFAIIQSGESFAYITASMGDMSWVNYVSSATCEYNTVYTSFSAKQTDTVSLGNSLGDANSLSTSVDTKYTGNYAIRYVLLNDKSNKDKVGSRYYETSYVGMANAYRDYLINSNQISKLEASEIKSQMPLYVQSFGALDIDSTFLSIPIEKRIALTKFTDIITMSDDFKKEGISNLRYILTGFANGTIQSSKYPLKIKWESAVGGNKGLNELLQYASENDIEIYPNFDFANVFRLGNGFSFDDYAAESMSGRFIKKRAYDPVYQTMKIEGFSNIVSSRVYSTLYSKFVSKYQKFNIPNLSVLTLGTDLNSDFNKDFPLTREDSKEYTKNLLATIAKDNNKVLVSSGNAYTLPYVTDIIEIPTDNSRFAISSASIPFMGMVLHGYVNYSGSAANTAGDLNYEILKAIENGASLYFMLSYDNTSYLIDAKGNASDYYSVNYETWFSDVVKYYKVVNEAIGSLQGAIVTGHDKVTAVRMNESDAYVIYKEYETLEKEYQAAKDAYYAAVETTDSLIRNQRDASSALADESQKKTAYLSLQNRVKLAKQMLGSNSVDMVVSVTYTLDGKDTTFYINYNSFDVVVYINGQACTIKANSFMKSTDLKGTTGDINKYETVNVWAPTENGASTFRKHQSALAAAVATGSAIQIERAQINMTNALSNMVKNENDVLKVKLADGNTMVINYTNSNVIVKVSDIEYSFIYARSYAIISGMEG